MAHEPLLAHISELVEEEHDVRPDRVVEGYQQ